MLDLDSPRWKTFEVAGGRPLFVPELIKRLGKRPTPAGWTEVWEQLSHQWTLYPGAYAAVPHLVALLRSQDQLAEPESLFSLGRVACPLERVAKCPADLRKEFEAALAQAGSAARTAAGSRGIAARDYLTVLLSAAALSGRARLGRLLLNAGSEEEISLECPGCHEELYERFSNRNAKASLWSDLDGKAPKTPVEPASPTAFAAKSELGWALGLAQKAGQGEAVAWLCGLGGRATCPRCRAAFLPFDHLG